MVLFTEASSHAWLHVAALLLAPDTMLLYLFLSAAAVPPKLTSDTFYEEVAKGRTFVFFHSPDCGHCRAMLPEWEALGERSPPDGCRLGSLDVTLEPAIADRFEVYGFPTLLLLEPSEGQMYEFRGERTVEAFSAFLEPEGFRGEVGQPR